ncbi:MAG TPA: SLC13 family permease [Terrimicrobiaceae bacterium]|jgi:di/tricarboxylate transporter|nr:SLC13 family permease [Terrimicrobiaceae bacterium]
MTPQILLLLILLAIAVALFWWERISAEVIALGLVLALAFTGLVPREEAFQGFGSDTVIMILGLLILTAALERTGVTDLAGRAVLRHADDSPDRLLLIIMAASAGIGAFMSNTASTAFFLPVVIGIAKKAGISPSKLLMPLAFSSIVSSSVTLVSTSTNMVVSGMMIAYGMPAMGMFELAPVGIPITLIGLAYMFLIRRFIPDRQAGDDLIEEFGVRPYLSEIVIQPGSNLAGKTLGEANVAQQLGLTVLRILRDNSQKLAVRAKTTLREGDTLIVEGSQADILKIKDTAGVEIVADAKVSASDLAMENTLLVQAVLLPGSPLLGRTLRRERFRESYGAQVLGINHHGTNVIRKLRDVPLRLGDVLLLQGSSENLKRLQESGMVRILGTSEALEDVRPRMGRAPLAIGIFVAMLALVTARVLSLPLAVMLGALLVFITRCITPEEAYARVEWKAIILIGSLLGLGAAMEHTGAAKYLAWQLVSLTGTSQPLLLLTVFFALTVFLTQPMSNQAAAIVILPIAIQTALHLNMNPRTFVMMVAISASCSYLTPLEPACLMVYGPGRYRFADFVRIGSLLTLLIYLISIVLVPLVWPLK